MELSNENIDRLIVRYLSGNLELQDKRVLETWISNNQDNYDYFLKMKNLWEVTHPAFDVRSISTTKALSRIKLKMGLREKRVIRIYRYWSRVAAVLIIPILFALIYMVADRFVEQDYSKISYQKISAPYGTRIQMNLPDGSIVWLNSGGELKYPTKFKAGERSVYLNGEAFFEVEKDSLRPFRVEMGGLEIEVLGTSFDAIGYAADPARQVILKSGSVSISGEGLSRPVRLCPDQKFTQSVLQGEFSIEQVDARNYCQWFEERLVFYNMPLTDIMVNLERKYHVEIVLSPSLPANKRLSLVVQHEPLEDIMEVISRLMPVRCQIDGDRVFVTNRGKSR